MAIRRNTSAVRAPPEAPVALEGRSVASSTAGIVDPRSHAIAPASVEAVDTTGAFFGSRALFVRAASTTLYPYVLARAAMAFLRRVDERPLVPATAEEMSESVRTRIREPWLDRETLHFWVRADGTSPYPSEVTVDLATGIHHGDVW